MLGPATPDTSAHLPWDLAAHLPWKMFTSPLEQWGHQPTFLIGEYLFITCAILAFIHARRSGRDHQLIFFGALIAGTANDMIFMALPLVDNFWQAQATLMLTPRLPLYIPCVYICFMYYPTAAVRRLGLPRLAQSGLSGIAAMLFYYPYDITGAKFLWWTWHDTDLPIAVRVLGAPASSTLWTLTFVAAFAWLVDRAIARDPQLPPRSFARGLATLAAFTTLLMMLQMTVLQQLDGGAPGHWALAAGVAVYAGLTWRGWSERRPRPVDAQDALLRRTIYAYLGAFVVMMAIFDPATHTSTGLHQTPGECYVEAKDITGLTRHKYLCVEDFDESFDFSCTDKPEDGAEWFTVCGRPHHDRPAWLGGILFLALMGGLLFRFLLGPSRLASGAGKN